MVIIKIFNTRESFIKENSKTSSKLSTNARGMFTKEHFLKEKSTGKEYYMISSAKPRLKAAGF